MIIGMSEADGDRSGRQEEEEDDDMSAVGFMFDAALPVATVRHSFSKPDGSSIEVVVACVDDTPGAVQSGHYVWPAAPALAQHLVDKWSTLGLQSNCRALELGAGCGLVGLTIAQLPVGCCSSVTFTDHDPGTLKLIMDSTKLQSTSPTARCETCALEWGRVKQGPLAGQSFDLIVGSDLIYCASVVRPLLETIRDLLDPSGLMVLMGSFVLTGDCEAAMVDGCGQLGLQRTVMARIGHDGSKVWLETIRRP